MGKIPVKFRMRDLGVTAGGSGFKCLWLIDV